MVLLVLHSLPSLFYFFVCRAFPAYISVVSLRMQVMEASENGGVVGGRSLERCFAEYVVCNMVLFLVVMNFMG